MGSESGHLRKVDHNKTFLELIQAVDSSSHPKFPDWMVTVAFYIAVHYVDAKLAGLTPSVHPGNHSERNTLVAVNLRSVRRDYFFLKNKSEYARYFPDSEVRISPQMVRRCINIALSSFI